MMTTETLTRGADKARRAVETLFSDQGELDILLSRVVAAIAQATDKASLYALVREAMAGKYYVYTRAISPDVVGARIARAFAMEHAMNTLDSAST